MKKRTVLIVSLVSILIIFQSCHSSYNISYDIFGEEFLNGGEVKVVEVPYKDLHEIKTRVLENAEEIASRDGTVYAYGNAGVDNPNYFDCSGFVLRCYADAVKETKYRPSYRSHRPTAKQLKTTYSTPTKDPRPGDLVFFNFAGGEEVNHVGIFVSYSNDRIAWIDASDWTGYKKVVDVRKRYLSDLEKAHKFKGYGALNFVKK